MKAKNLTIGGESIEKGERYFAVTAINSFDLTIHHAGDENNTYGYCYFKKKNEALHYQRLCLLNKLISYDIKNIEDKHHAQ